MPKYYSYKIVRDYGFAPNPFHGFCTLATCKPHIRKTASIGDWIFCTGAITTNLKGRIIYLMKVTDKVTFENYSTMDKYKVKIPIVPGKLDEIHGDNIYSQDESNNWIQTLSQHSNLDGSENSGHKKTDLSGKFVLISDEFYYFGNRHFLIPKEFEAICSIYRDFFIVKNQKVAEAFIDYIRFNYPMGRIGIPINWVEYSQQSLFD